MQSVTVTEFRLKLYLKNFALVREFYEVRLQFPVVHEWDRGETNKGVMFDVGGTILELLSPPEGYHRIAGADVSLGVPNVKELWELMGDSHTVLHSLRHNKWGDTSFRVADPEGFAITFFTKDE